MQLTMTVLRCPDAVPPETRSISGGEFSVGRGPGVEWVLPDSERLLSKRHFAVAYRSGAWQLADTSTNGTYLNRETAAIGNGDVRSLRDGDRIRLGAYEIEIRLVEEAIGRIGDAPSGIMAGGGDMARGQATGASPFGDPFGMDPFAPARPERTPFDEPARANIGLSPTGAQLPHDFDPLAPEPGEGPFRGPTQSDHSPVMEDAFRPPPAIGQVSLHTGGVIPGDDLLPDDWDKELLEGIAPSPGAPAAQPSVARPSQPPQPAPQPRPPVAAPPPPPLEPHAPSPYAPSPHAQSPYAPSPTDDEPFAEASDALAADASPFDEPPAAPRPAPPPRQPVAPAAQQPPAPRPAAAAPPKPQARADESTLLAAFLEGVGLPEAQPKDAAATMLELGKAFRTLVSGLRAVLIARATIKSEFRIEQTMIRARGNNPLKFSSGDDDALSALLGAGRHSDMAPHEAVADALRDIRLHELASMSAMQAAVRSMLDGLDPAKLRVAAEQGGMTVIPAQKKARAWDAYEALHARTVQALSDDFDSAFGKAFARAYERALNEVSAKELG